MEVMISTAAVNSSPPKLGPFFFSAPTSPTHPSEFDNDFNNGQLLADHQSLLTIPFRWEYKPGIPKEDVMIDDYDAGEFAFDFSGQLEMPKCSSADELFDGGKIKPLKPPPRLQSDSWSRNSLKEKEIKCAISSVYIKKDSDPFEVAIQESRRSSLEDSERGRERINNNLSKHLSRSRKNGTRSLSPYRVSDVLPDDEKIEEKIKGNGSSFWQRKWEKYRILKKKKKREKEDVKKKEEESFRTSVSSISSSRAIGRFSADEILEYEENKDMVEETMKKTTTLLPYKQSLFGCFGFNRGASLHAISRGISSVNP